MRERYVRVLLYMGGAAWGLLLLTGVLRHLLDGAEGGGRTRPVDVYALAAPPMAPTLWDAFPEIDRALRARSKPRPCSEPYAPRAAVSFSAPERIDDPGPIEQRCRRPRQQCAPASHLAPAL